MKRRRVFRAIRPWWAVVGKDGKLKWWLDGRPEIYNSKRKAKAMIDRHDRHASLVRIMVCEEAAIRAKTEGAEG